MTNVIMHVHGGGRELRRELLDWIRASYGEHEANRSLSGRMLSGPAEVADDLVDLLDVKLGKTSFPNLPRAVEVNVYPTDSDPGSRSIWFPVRGWHHCQMDSRGNRVLDEQCIQAVLNGVGTIKEARARFHALLGLAQEQVLADLGEMLDPDGLIGDGEAEPEPLAQVPAQGRSRTGVSAGAGAPASGRPISDRTPA